MSKTKRRHQKTYRDFGSVLTEYLFPKILGFKNEGKKHIFDINQTRKCGPFIQEPNSFAKTHWITWAFKNFEEALAIFEAQLKNYKRDPMDFIFSVERERIGTFKYSLKTKDFKEKENHRPDTEKDYFEKAKVPGPAGLTSNTK